MFPFENLLKAMQFLSRKTRMLIYINTVYYIYFLRIDQVEKHYIKHCGKECIHFWRHNLWNYNSIWQLRGDLLRNYPYRLKFSFLPKLLRNLYSAINRWLQFAPVVENKLLGLASDKFSRNLGQNIKAFLSVTICESDPWHICLHIHSTALLRLRLLL